MKRPMWWLGLIASSHAVIWLGESEDLAELTSREFVLASSTIYRAADLDCKAQWLSFGFFLGLILLFSPSIMALVHY